MENRLLIATFSFVFTLISVTLCSANGPFVGKEKVTGYVFGAFSSGKEPLPNATVNWLGTNEFATTNDKGYFEIELSSSSILLTASFVGFGSKTLRVESAQEVTFVLEDQTLTEVEIIERIRATEIDLKSAALTFEMGKKELAKAACCNLSESFENNASIDVAFADAVTGSRQIELLGLSGKYAQLQNEMLPFGRGLLPSMAFNYIPGTWIESIQVSKGVGSVVNGFESMTGQINLELVKPWEEGGNIANLYLGENGRTEVNYVQNFQLNDKWSTGALLHYNIRPFRMDRNGNGFMDVPLGQQVNLLNRWKYQGKKGWEAQFYLRAIQDVTNGGQMAIDFDAPSHELWGSQMRANRLEVMGKLGYVFAAKPYQSFGLLYSASTNTFDSQFGNNTFEAKQQSAYVNTIFHSIIGTTTHQYSVGLSFTGDQYDKAFGFSNLDTNTTRLELIGGAFGEYTFTPNENITAVFGSRLDYHNTLGMQFTPRLHLRYATSENTTFRFGGGSGWRTAHAVIENISFLATSRELLQPNQLAAWEATPFREKNWNVGVSWVQNFRLNYRKGSIVTDYYYTQFTDQIVADWDISSRSIGFYALEGRSFSHAFTTTIDYEIFPRFDVRIAYKFLDTRTDFTSGLLQRALIPRHRGLINVAYETKSDWKFDLTLNVFGQKRIPITGDVFPEDRQPDWSPVVPMVHAQINKTLNAKWEVYIGGENLLNFRQDNPIVAPENPFGDRFDASLIWGPIFGRMAYLGVNFKF